MVVMMELRVLWRDPTHMVTLIPRDFSFLAYKFIATMADHSGYNVYTYVLAIL